MRKATHELQWLEIKNSRTLLTEEENVAYQRLKKGQAGEKEFDQWMELILKQKLSFLDDKLIEYLHQIVQIDKLLLAGATLYVLDMKKYSGHYSCKNNVWYKNDERLVKNILEQLRQAVRLIQNILRRHHIDIEVKGVLVFMDPDSSIEICDPIDEIVLNYGQISSWLKSLPQVSKPVDWQNAICAHEIKAFRTRRHFDRENMDQLQKGICCSVCGGFAVTEKKNIVACTCGHIEAKLEAYLRTVCECGTLFHDQYLTKKLLLTFFGERVNARYLEYILKRYFVIHKRASRATDYYNKGILYEYWFENQKEELSRSQKRIHWKNASQNTNTRKGQPD